MPSRRSLPGAREVRGAAHLQEGRRVRAIRRCTCAISPTVVVEVTVDAAERPLDDVDAACAHELQIRL